MIRKEDTDMKKTYFTPTMGVVHTDAMNLLSGSGVESSLGIDYGGVDTEGTMEPGAPELSGVPDYSFD